MILWIQTACFITSTEANIDFTDLNELYGRELRDLNAGRSFPFSPLFAAARWDFEEIVREECLDMGTLDDLNYNKGVAAYGLSAIELAFAYYDRQGSET